MGISREYFFVLYKTRHILLSDSSKMCLVLYKTKNIPEGRPLPPEILAPSDLPSPNSSKSWHVLPCSASTVRASEKSSIMTNMKSFTSFPTSYRWSAYVTSKYSICTLLPVSGFWATVCKTVRPMLSVRCLSVLSCLWRSCTVAKQLNDSRRNLTCR